MEQTQQTLAELQLQHCSASAAKGLKLDTIYCGYIQSPAITSWQNIFKKITAELLVYKLISIGWSLYISRGFTIWDDSSPCESMTIHVMGNMYMTIFINLSPFLRDVKESLRVFFKFPCLQCSHEAGTHLTRGYSNCSSIPNQEILIFG